MILRTIYTDELAQASYLVGCSATGEALIIDPTRDIEQYIQIAASKDLHITAVTETHIHADFVSGARELAQCTGAQLYLSDAGPAEWKYRYAANAHAKLLQDGEIFKVGNIRLQALHTPGHTPEHLSFLCKAAGLTDEAGKPYKDAMGPITSHRARSSTAYYLKAMGMTPYDIGKLLGHTNPNKTLPWYLKENLHQLGRMYRKANPLDRTVHALLDTDAVARSEPCVFYYLSDRPDGRPRLCGNPNFRTCYHQLQCAECAAYVEVEMAEVIEQRPGVVHISVPLPLPEQLVDDLNKREEGIPVAETPPPPPIPSSAFHFNKNAAACIASDQSVSEGDQLRFRLKGLEAQLVTKKKQDARNVSTRLLKQEIDEIKRQLAELEGAKEKNG